MDHSRIHKHRFSMTQGDVVHEEPKHHSLVTRVGAGKRRHDGALGSSHVVEGRSNLAQRPFAQPRNTSSHCFFFENDPLHTLASRHSCQVPRAFCGSPIEPCLLPSLNPLGEGFRGVKSHQCPKSRGE